MMFLSCGTAPADASTRILRCPVFAMLVAAMVLLGCAEQRIREQSQLSMSGGDYEQGIHVLEDGLKQFPESPVLRGGLVQAKNEALTRTVANAGALRAAGKLDEARDELMRAKALDPQNRRIDALLSELDTEKRQQLAMSEAEALLAKKRPEAALRSVEQALKDNPRHAGLLALQRRLEMEQRQSQTRAAQSALAEIRPISLDFRDASLRTVLDVVSRSSGINFILDKDIRPDIRVTVYLRQAKVEEALDLIIGTNQLAKKVIDPQTIVIYTNTPEKQREYQEQIVRVFYLASAEAKGAATFLKSMLRIREPFVDERSNMLAVRESPENIQLAERLIALYDANEPEVLMEVEVLEVNSSRLTELGVQLPTSFSLTPLAPDGSSNLTLGNIRSISRDRIALGLGGITVNLRREVGDFTTLANPKIRARNREKAKVMIGDKIPIITSTSGSTGFVADNVSYLDVGLKLEVEPTIYADDDVAIKVALESSTLGTAVRTASGTLAYQIGTRNASTVLRLHDGETQLLAGLISKDDRMTSSRVPGVGDLPVLGRLFSDQTDNGHRTELVLAITPRILRNIRRPDASETELWVGTEALPRLQPVGGMRVRTVSPDPSTPIPAGSTVAAAGAKGSETAISSIAESPAEPAVFGGPQLMWSGATEAKVGDAVELKLILNGKAPVRGLALEFGVGSDKLQLLDVVEGDYFRQRGAATSFTKSAVAKDGGFNVGVLRNEGTGVSGQGPVLTLRFKAMAEGTSEVVLRQASPIGPGAGAASVTLPPTVAIKIR